MIFTPTRPLPLVAALVSHVNCYACADSVWFPVLMFAWSASEVIRYPYYLAATIHKYPAALEWLRYSAFILLYPMYVLGWVTCDGLMVFAVVADS